jgi:hypothetical protein
MSLLRIGAKDRTRGRMSCWWLTDQLRPDGLAISSVTAKTTTPPPSSASTQSCRTILRDSSAAPIASDGQPISRCKNGFFGLPVLMPSFYTADAPYRGAAARAELPVILRDSVFAQLDPLSLSFLLQLFPFALGLLLLFFLTLIGAVIVVGAIWHKLTSSSSEAKRSTPRLRKERHNCEWRHEIKSEPGGAAT